MVWFVLASCVPTLDLPPHEGDEGNPPSRPRGSGGSDDPEPPAPAVPFRVLTAIGDDQDDAVTVTAGQPDVKLVPAGCTGTDGDNGSSVGRSLRDGELDPSFGGGEGVVTTDLDSSLASSRGEA